MNGTVRAVLTSLTKRAIYAWNDQILCNGKGRAVGKISVKNAKLYDKKCRLSLISRYF